MGLLCEQEILALYEGECTPSYEGKSLFLVFTPNSFPALAVSFLAKGEPKINYFCGFLYLLLAPLTKSHIS